MLYVWMSLRGRGAAIEVAACVAALVLRVRRPAARLVRQSRRVHPPTHFAAADDGRRQRRPSL